MSVAKPLKHQQTSQKHTVGYQKGNKAAQLLDRFIYVIGIGGPSMTIPQVIKIWSEKNASGISILAWSGYTFFAILWFFYGINHNQKPIIATNATIIVLNTLVIVGAVLYG